MLFINTQCELCIYCYFMCRNIIDNDKILKISQEIENESNGITEDINKIYRLIELLPQSFSTKDSIKICNILKDKNLLMIKKYNEKIFFMKVILEKINLAHASIESTFSSKKMIDN